MAKNAAKRPIDESTEDSKVVNKQTEKKFKPNGNVPQQPKKPSNAVDKKITNGVKPTNGETNIVVKKEKKLKYTPEQFLEMKKARILAKKEKMLAKKKKELEEKNENRRLKRQQGGDLNIENIKKTEAQIDAQIEEIRSRPEITKTAKRKLGLLQKQKKILNGTANDKTINDVPTLNANEKRKLRRVMSKTKLQLEAAGKDSKVKVEKKNNDVKVKEEKKNVKTIVATNKQNVKNNEQSKVQKVTEQKPKAESDDDDDDDDDDEDDDDDDEDEDEDDDDDEGDSTLNTTDNNADSTLNSTFNTSSNTSMEQNDDGDDDDEEEEEKMEITTPKVEEKKKQQQKTPQDSQKKRFVLFVGNLPFDATDSDLKKHFLTKCSEVISVRIVMRADNTPKGIAFVEFNNKIDYEKALSLHNTILNGRKLVVQYSDGGSKNKSHSAAKNKKLHALRAQGKLAGSTKDSNKRNARRNNQKKA